MRNVPINEAETIFEPFWDGGESYPCSEKYSVLANYRVTYAPDAIARIAPSWFGAHISIQKGGSDGFDVVMERDCDLAIEEYDIFRIFASLSENMQVTITCRIDGRDTVVLERTGAGITCEMEDSLQGSKITHICVGIRLTDGRNAAGSLYWFGLSNAAKQKEMESKKSPYTPDWEGCFADTFTVEPRIGIFIDKNELEMLRDKVKMPPFDRLLAQLREKAEEYLTWEPEQEIGTYLAIHSRRFERDRDMKKKYALSNAMQTLAVVGSLDNNEDMLRMACRCALSAAHHTYWCESVMGMFPGATWHHRSFTEEAVCTACATVLDLAGNLLTWHGRNIIYDAIMMKGLPRIECDFKRMDYLHEMNQGIVFSNGRITALLALVHEYPRYKSWLEEAERECFAAVERYMTADGGTTEGPGYWNYTFIHVISVCYMLARYHKQDLSDYVPETVRRTGRYGLAMLSSLGEGTSRLPVNDSALDPYTNIIPAFYAMLGDDPKWMEVYQKVGRKVSTEFPLIYLMIAPPLQPCERESVASPAFYNLTEIGQVGYISQTDDVGLINMHLLSGPVIFSHCHSDKGSFILEAAGEMLAVDRGSGDYATPASNTSAAGMHNLFMPQTDGFFYNQLKVNGGTVTESRLEDGILLYTTDNKNAWQQGLYRRNYRRVFSPDPHLYIINDDVEYEGELISAFLINTYAAIEEGNGCWAVKGEHARLLVTPCQWTPHDAYAGPDGTDGKGRPMNQLRLYAAKDGGHNLFTILEVVKAGQQSSLSVSAGKLLWNGNELTCTSTKDGCSILYSGQRYTARNGAWEKN